MAENGPIEKMADIISEKIFKRFKWKKYGPINQDFPCRKEDSHKPSGKKQSHTHPVDIVFGYLDPYLNKNILLNTDLKSYSHGSINPSMIEGALTSLGNTISCASNSEEWQRKYMLCNGPFEVRGLLFVYNHDNELNKCFYDFFFPQQPKTGRRATGVNLSKIKVDVNTQIHIIEPKVINYMMTMVADMNEMIQEKTFPNDDYGFYYPQLTFHKPKMSKKHQPASIELLTAPFLVIKHDSTAYYNRKKGEEEIVSEEGYIVYYNRAGNTTDEFIYLLDTLSKYQILDGENKIRIRVAHESPCNSIQSHFQRALERYAYTWDFDDDAIEQLNEIGFYCVPLTKEFYSKEQIGWR